MGCGFSSANFKPKKQKVVQLKASISPIRIQQRCRMNVMKEMGKELRRLYPEVDFKKNMNNGLHVDRNRSQAAMKMASQKADEPAVWTRQFSS